VKIRFLLDENMSPRQVGAVLRRNSAIDIVRVGSPGMPPLGTPDPDILVFCEAEQRLLVTKNHYSMPGHIADHFAAGRHHWGVFRLSRDLTLSQLAEQIEIFWEASEAEEWRDRLEYIPW